MLTPCFSCNSTASVQEVSDGRRVEVWCMSCRARQPGTRPAGSCEQCKERPATSFWCPGGGLAYAHGQYSCWCELCVVKEQLRLARELAAKIPDLEAQLLVLQHAGLAEQVPSATGPDGPRR